MQCKFETVNGSYITKLKHLNYQIRKLLLTKSYFTAGPIKKPTTLLDNVPLDLIPL